MSVKQKLKKNDFNIVKDKNRSYILDPYWGIIAERYKNRKWRSHFPKKHPANIAGIIEQEKTTPRILRHLRKVI